MANQLIPPPSMMPPAPDELDFDQRAALWVDLIDTGEKLLLAGLRRDVGPHGDIGAAYRAWYAEQMADHDRYWRQYAARLARAGARHGR
jgi:hypothetical protein